MRKREFKARVEAVGIRSARVIDAARRVLCGGEVANQVAVELDVDRAQLSRAINRIRDAELCPCCGQEV